MNQLAPLTADIVAAKQGQQMNSINDDDLGAFLRDEVKKALNRLGRKQIDPDVLKIAVEDIANDLRTKYRVLTLEEVSIAFREGARRNDEHLFSSRTLAQWLDHYMRAIRVIAFDETPKPKKALPQETFDREQFILKAFDRFNIGGGLYGAERLYHHLEQMGKIDMTTIEKWQALKDTIEKEMEDTANCISNPILRNAARKRMDELKAAKLEPTKAEEWIRVATMRHIVESYFRKCYLSKVSPV
jgi:hypothetical protein